MATRVGARNSKKYYEPPQPRAGGAAQLDYRVNSWGEFVFSPIEQTLFVHAGVHFALASCPRSYPLWKPAVISEPCASVRAGM